MLLILFLLGATTAVPTNLINLRYVTYAHAVDFSALASVNDLICLKNSGYSVAFIRGYNPVGYGSFDSNSVPNIKNAYNIGLGTEVYMTPVQTKTAAQQFDELYNGLYNAGITIRTIWFQVVSPQNWNSNPSANRNFVSSLIVKAQSRSISSGIYTSAYDWGRIMGNSTVAAGTKLWYYNTNGTMANFNDFKNFGGFGTPSVKQYSQVRNVCSLTVNLDVYKAYSASLVQTVDDKKITVGGFITE